MTKIAMTLSIFAFALVFPACQQANSDDATAQSVVSAPTAMDPGSTPEHEAEIEYEPAYPTDVSSDGLSEDDVAQQEATHAHDGGEEHVHDTSQGEEGAHDDHGH